MKKDFNTRRTKMNETQMSKKGGRARAQRETYQDERRFEFSINSKTWLIIFPFSAGGSKS